MTDQPKEELHIQGGEEETAQEPQPSVSSDETTNSEEQGASKQSSSGSSLSSLMSTPQSYGDKAGSTINSTLGKVGHPLGKGLETIAAPVGGVVGAVANAPFKAGEMATGKGESGEPVKEALDGYEKDEETLKAKGGKEQTGQNPLGL